MTIFYCQTGQTAQVTVNGEIIDSYSAPISYHLTSQSYWDYIFVGTLSSGGCKTWYSAIYREPVDVTPLLEVDFRSGQSGSCSLPIKDIRAKVSFDGGNTFKKLHGLSNSSTAPSSNNQSNFYPNGVSYNWHGYTVEGALPRLFSKTQTSNYNLKIYSNSNLVFEKDYSEQPTINVTCSGIAQNQLPHDCINNKCRPSSQHNTEGFFKSLAECEAVCGSGSGCNGECVSKAKLSQLKNLANRLKRKNCGY